MTTLLDLALIVPAGYDDLTLSKVPQIGIPNVIDATVLSQSSHPKHLKILLRAHNFADRQIQAITFNPRRYHRELFKAGTRLYLRGRLEYNYGTYQMIQPRKIDHIDTILPRYRSRLANRTLVALMRRYLTRENLARMLPFEEAVEALLAIHRPTSAFAADYLRRGGFDERTLYALKLTEIYNHLRKLSSKRSRFPAKRSLRGDLTPFIHSLPFTLTHDQRRVIEEIAEDLRSKTAAKRVIMGDVGCGKTMVILASVMLARPFRSILMAPTTVLATQIYEEARRYLPDDLRIALVTQKSDVDRDEDLSRYDFLIGTQALLHRRLPEADLIMIDEQHRFGTKQRAMIAKMVGEGDSHPHFLQFSATPIPRTLSMIESTLIDISIIRELPYNKKITTRIVRKADFSDLLAHIRKESEEGRQTIVVYPLVEESEAIGYQSIDEARSFWEKRFERVYVTHGKDREKEEILERFREEGSILLATTLIEVGISLPRLSTIVIVAPERLGLATLHQLRGRVSRNGLEGYCFLFTKADSSKRLEAFAKTLDGFEIAELDLKYRQGGDLLKGEAQSGRSFVWFDPAEDEAILKKAKKFL